MTGLWQKYGPPGLARGLWGRGPMPTRYKLLFAGQSIIFTMAIYIRTKDVEKAQHIKKLQMADAERKRLEGDAAATFGSGSGETGESSPGDR